MILDGGKPYAAQAKAAYRYGEKENNVMQAMLIATGEENKLLPLTTTMPTPMVPIVDRPVMVYLLELLARAGIRDIWVNLYEQASTIERYFGHGERWSVNLHYLLHRTACGSVGALKRAGDLLTETFLILPADRLIDLDIKAALRCHQAHGGIATAILVPQPMDKAAPAHLVSLDEQGRLQPGCPPDMAHTAYAYTGAFIFEPTILQYFSGQSTAGGHPQLMAALHQAQQAVYGYVMEGYWNPLLTFRDYQAAQCAVLTSLDSQPRPQAAPRLRHPYVEAGEVAPGIWIGPNSIVHPSVRLTPPLFIGAGCRIGRHAELGPETVIGTGVVIDEGVTIQQSTVLSHTYIGQFLHLSQRVAHRAELIDITTGTNVQIADPWLLTAVNPSLPGSLLRNLVERGVALLLLIAAAPLLLAIGLVLWLTAGNPILTRIQRFGLMPLVRGNPQLLKLYQFKTRRTDQSYTVLGRFLETYELQRLPELWNVVCGDIGLVGVKPLSLEETLALQEAWQQGRFGAQAGFTGLWYTQATHTTDADELCIMDAYQAVTHTWRDDYRQLWLTPGAWLKRWQQAKRPQQYGRIEGNQPHSQAKGLQAFYSEQESKPLVTTKLSEPAAPLQFSSSDRL